jgi:hypothetical protein
MLQDGKPVSKSDRLPSRQGLEPTPPRKGFPTNASLGNSTSADAGTVKAPATLVTECRLPTEAKVERAKWPRAPWAGFDLCNRLCTIHTRSGHHGLTQNRSRFRDRFERGVSPSPAFNTAAAMDRTHGLLLLAAGKGLLVTAALELDEPLSWHPALRVSQQVIFRPPGRMASPASLRPVGTGFTGLAAPNIKMPNHVFRAGFEWCVPYGEGAYK